MLTKLNRFILLWIVGVLFPIFTFAQHYEDRVIHRNQNIEWAISLKQVEENSNFFYLRSELKSNKGQQHICFEPIKPYNPISLQVFEYDSSISKYVHPLDFYLTKLWDHELGSQFIIENDNGIYETFSFNTKMPRTSNKVIVSGLFVEVKDFYDILYLYESGRTVIFLEKVSLTQLKLKHGKEKIRIHYLNPGCKIMGIDRFSISSNWIELPDL